MTDKDELELLLSAVARVSAAHPGRRYRSRVRCALPGGRRSAPTPLPRSARCRGAMHGSTQ